MEGITRKRRESSSSIYWVSLTSIPNPTSPFTRTLFSRALSRTDCRETRLHSIARATCHSSAQSPVTCQTFRFHFHVSTKSHRCTSSWWTFSRSLRSIENQWVEILHLSNVWIVILSFLIDIDFHYVIVCSKKNRNILISLIFWLTLLSGISTKNFKHIDLWLNLKKEKITISVILMLTIKKVHETNYRWPSNNAKLKILIFGISWESM